MSKRKRRKSTRRRNRKTITGRIKRLIRKLKKYGKWMFAICLVLGICYLLRDYAPSVFKNSRQTVAANDYNGIDVSKYQGKINWDKVAKNSHIQFVYIKASEGATRVDKNYHDYIEGARNAGLKVGSYHYFIGRKSAQEQFANFNRYIDKGKQDLIPMVDVEEAGNRNISRVELQRKLNVFMQLVKDEYGEYPLLYSQYRFYKEKLSPEFNKYFLFIARYSSQPPSLGKSGKYNIWQYTENGHIDGIKGHVDLDRFASGTSLSDIEL